MAYSAPNTGSSKLANYFQVTADMSSATWNTQASHEIVTVTGLVHLFIVPRCTGTLTDAADLASIQLGVEGSTAALIASTGAAGFGAATIAAGEFWVDATPTELVFNGASFDTLNFIPGSGLDVGYEITGAALTGGTMVFDVWWEALDATGSCAAGAGGSL